MDPMNQHKRMASGMSPAAGNFGVKPFPSSGAAMHPDAASGLGMKGAMADADRGIGMPIMHAKNHHPAQAAPIHGPNHPGGHGADWKREGKV